MSPLGPAAAPAAEYIRDLAALLIAHHLRMSVPDPSGRDRLIRAYAGAKFPVQMMERGTRCIAVVGAGASVPILSRGDELATELEAQFGKDEVELDRLRLVHNFDPKDFETRLLALSKDTEAARRVRETISEKSEIEHPTLLVYELLAHLVKHRFIDAIIDFNFDELLDRSLTDELGEGEFRRVVSDRDCRDLVTDPYRSSYLPLHIKLHGTASEPDSLRFTPEAYYSLPARIVEQTSTLMEGPHCVVVTVGFGLASFDFWRLLAKPQALEVFNLSYDSVPDDIVAKINAERNRPGPKNAARPKADRAAIFHEGNPEHHGSGELLKQLIETIQTAAAELSGGLLRWRPVTRHESVASLLGPGTMGPIDASAAARKRERTDYSYQRAVLELTFAAAKGRGLLSLGPLAEDRPARYYDEYRNRANGDIRSWQALCSAAGLAESFDAPDRLVSDAVLRADRSDERRRHETMALHLFDAVKLAEHVLPRVKNQSTEEDRDLLVTAIEDLQTDTEIEIRVHDDRVCSKAFTKPALLATSTAVEIYTWLILRNRANAKDAVFISDENGDWLLRSPLKERLVGRKRLYVLLAFEDNAGELKKAFPGVKVRVANPWLHNRHMVIACRRRRPERAVYFARRLRSPAVTPVYLESDHDALQLRELFEARWNDSRPVGGLSD
jgi:hypothetical protein